MPLDMLPALKGGVSESEGLVMMDFEEQSRRYMHDGAWHQLVDMLIHLLRQGHWTVSELRDAATFAGIQFEARHVHRRWVMAPDGTIEPVDR